MPPAPERDRGGAAGFTLLEVLVAFVIAALALGVMFDGLVSGLRVASAAAHTEAAVALARSRMAEAQAALDAGTLTAVSDQQGDDGGGFHWSVQVRPVQRVVLARPADADTQQSPGKATLYSVTVEVGWRGDGGQRSVRLDGARLELRDAPAS